VAAEAAEQRHAVDDLAAPLGEVVDGPLGDAGEVGDAVAGAFQVTPRRRVSSARRWVS